MAIQPVRKMGNRRLSQPSELLTQIPFPGLAQLLEDMNDTMQHTGGIGIAAPQIGVNQRVIMFGFEHSYRYPNRPPVPFTTLINPQITILSPEMNDDWEGCLSVPGLRGLVPRYTHIHYQGYDPQGNLIERTVEGFHARVVQHECDHLDGILYPYRLKDIRAFGFEEELINNAKA